MLQHVEGGEVSILPRYLLGDTSFLSWNLTFSSSWALCCVFIIHLLNPTWGTETITPSNIPYKFTGKQGRSKSISVPSACIHWVLLSPGNSGATSSELFDAWNYREDGWSFLLWFVCCVGFVFFFLETSWKDDLLFRAGPVPGCNFRTPSSLEVKSGRQ